MAHSLKAGTPPGETGRAGPDNRTLNSHGLAVRKSACAGEYLLQSETWPNHYSLHINRVGWILGKGNLVLGSTFFPCDVLVVREWRQKPRKAEWIHRCESVWPARRLFHQQSRVSSFERSANLGSYADTLDKCDRSYSVGGVPSSTWSSRDDQGDRVPRHRVIYVAPLSRGSYRLRWWLYPRKGIRFLVDNTTAKLMCLLETIAGLNANPVSFLRREDDNVFYASWMHSNHSATTAKKFKVMSSSWTLATQGDGQCLKAP